MFNFFNILAFKITKENWGFPWHINLALILTQISAFILLKFVDFPHTVAFAWVIVNFIGLINEYFEKKKGNNPKKDFWQDMLANNIGWLLGVALLWLIV